jgi:hypothetical protein
MQFTLILWYSYLSVFMRNNNYTPYLARSYLWYSYLSVFITYYYLPEFLYLFIVHMFLLKLYVTSIYKLNT